MSLTIPMWRMPFMRSGDLAKGIAIIPAFLGMTAGIGVYAVKFHVPGEPANTVGIGIGVAILLMGIALGVLLSRRVAKPDALLTLTLDALVIAHPDGKVLLQVPLLDVQAFDASDNRSSFDGDHLHSGWRPALRIVVNSSLPLSKDASRFVVKGEISMTCPGTRIPTEMVLMAKAHSTIKPRFHFRDEGFLQLRNRLVG